MISDEIRSNICVNVLALDMLDYGDVVGSICKITWDLGRVEM